MSMTTKSNAACEEEQLTAKMGVFIFQHNTLTKVNKYLCKRKKYKAHNKRKANEEIPARKLREQHSKSRRRNDMTFTELWTRT